MSSLQDDNVLDDAEAGEFASIWSYSNFAHNVRRARRYVWSTEIERFLATVLATLDGRAVSIPKGQQFFRAQQGVDYREELDDEGCVVYEEPIGFNRDRMKPLKDRAREGRINPTGIPVLYLASGIETAISEVRPWVGSEVSVGKFRVKRDLTAVRLVTDGASPRGAVTFDQLAGAAPVDAATKEHIVWGDIDQAFARPILRSDDSADYAPTQILAELFRDAGHDAVIYASQFGEQGFNIALFDVQDADIYHCDPYQVDQVSVNFAQTGNRWYRQPEASD